MQDEEEEEQEGDEDYKEPYQGHNGFIPQYGDASGDVPEEEPAGRSGEFTVKSCECKTELLFKRMLQGITVQPKAGDTPSRWHGSGSHKNWSLSVSM